MEPRCRSNTDTNPVSGPARDTQGVGRDTESLGRATIQDGREG
jgi:hypothetical protein